MSAEGAVNGYHPQVVELFQHTPFAGEMKSGAGVHSGGAGSQSQGSEVRFWLKSGGGRIQAISFRAFGCPHTIAAAAWLAHQVRGLAFSEIDRLSWREVERALAVPPQKRGRLLIVEDALKSAVKAATGNV
jgi:NifU-like protein involved in Fe-S cluster formation